MIRKAPLLPRDCPGGTNRAFRTPPVPSMTVVPRTESVGEPLLSRMVPVPETVGAPPAKTAFWGWESSAVKVSAGSSAASWATSTVIAAPLNPAAIVSVALLLAA